MTSSWSLGENKSKPLGSVFKEVGAVWTNNFDCIRIKILARIQGVGVWIESKQRGKGESGATGKE